MSYGPPRGKRELDAFTAIFAQSFNVPSDRAALWMGRAKRQELRVLRRGGSVVAGLVILPMGQWYGGRVVPMAGIAAVGVEPDQRASGAGSELMRETLKELHRRGVATSTLYPATVPVYRRVGYEHAGTWLNYRLATRLIAERDRGLTVRRAKASDRGAMMALYTARARTRAGLADRRDYLWTRVFEPTIGTKAHGYVVERKGRIEGYTFFYQQANDKKHFDLYTTDWVAATPDATRRLLAFFASHRSLADDVIWQGGPTEPLFLITSEHEAKVDRFVRWMTRIVDVKRALESRGYAETVDVEAHLDVRDELLSGNHGRFVATIRGGRAAVRRGGGGRVQLTINGLASLFTGYAAPAELVVAGLMSGPDSDLGALQAAFAGPAPHLTDFF